MEIPAQLIGRVCKTKITGIQNILEKISEIQNLYPNSKVKVMFDNKKPVVVVIFDNEEDCLEFKLKYGEDYV